MTKKILLGIVIGVASIATGLEKNAGAAPAEPNAKLLFHCLLDKSNSLNVYRSSREQGSSIIFEVENFLSGKETVLEVQSPVIVDYGNTFIAMKDEGRSGYFLLRFERGRKPASEDIGDSTVLLDNNLFQVREKRFFTGGELSTFHDCTSARDPN